MPYKFEVTINYPDDQVSSQNQYTSWVESQIGESNFRKLSEFLQRDLYAADVKIIRSDNTDAMTMTRMYQTEANAKTARSAIAGYLMNMGGKATITTPVRITQEEFDTANAIYNTRQ